jgi:hypothetical protein
MQAGWNRAVKNKAARLEVDFKGAAPKEIGAEQSVDSKSSSLPVNVRR